jgi:hypothetical protein
LADRPSTYGSPGNRLRKPATDSKPSSRNRSCSRRCQSSVQVLLIACILHPISCDSTDEWEDHRDLRAATSPGCHEYPRACSSAWTRSIGVSREPIWQGTIHVRMLPG